MGLQRYSVIRAPGRMSTQPVPRSHEHRSGTKVDCLLMQQKRMYVRTHGRLHLVHVFVVVLDRLLVDVLPHLGGDAHVDLSPVKVLVRRRLSTQHTITTAQHTTAQHTTPHQIRNTEGRKFFCVCLCSPNATHGDSSSRDKWSLVAYCRQPPRKSEGELLVASLRAAGSLGGKIESPAQLVCDFGPESSSRPLEKNRVKRIVLSYGR